MYWAQPSAVVAGYFELKDMDATTGLALQHDEHNYNTHIYNA